ncbi:glycosyltransferase family 4 protein [Mucilaginibacter sp.]
MPEHVRLLTLQTFSTTGGIQKMTRTLGYALQQLAGTHQFHFECWSLYDAPFALMPQYLPPQSFRGFANARIRFVWANIKAGRRTQVLILSHINLAMVGLLIKLVNPRCRIYLIAHGIEVWRPLSFVQKRLLKLCTRILCVSHFTQQQVQQLHQLPAGRTQVLNNALDPYMHLPDRLEKPDYLLQRYGLDAQHQLLFTLTRLASTEQYKGYEQVIKAVAQLKDAYPQLRYMLAGQYDAAEEKRITRLIETHNLQRHVIVTGFIADKELTDHFLLADLFVLPSKKEGFGLVFIEALACGLPVISGNADGSADAVRNGELGHSINADSAEELEQAIARCLAQPPAVEKRKELQTKCVHYFNEAQYRTQLWNILHERTTA